MKEQIDSHLEHMTGDAVKLTINCLGNKIIDSIEAISSGNYVNEKINIVLL